MFGDSLVFLTSSRSYGKIIDILLLVLFPMAALAKAMTKCDSNWLSMDSSLISKLSHLGEFLVF